MQILLMTTQFFNDSVASSGPARTWRARRTSSWRSGAGGQGDVDALLQPPPQRLVDVPREVRRRQHHHLRARAPHVPSEPGGVLLSDEISL